MSKQVYIDSNGNEIQVSGTVNTADMMPMSASDSTKVSEAIGDLSDLTTSVTSSIVGAVNELDKLTDYTDGLSYHAGVTRYLGSIYKQGKLVVCNLTLRIEQNINNNETVVSGLPTVPSRSHKFPCFVGTDQYMIGNSDGAIYLQVNTTSLVRWGNLTATSSNPKYITMMFVYATA